MEALYTGYDDDGISGFDLGLSVWNDRLIIAVDAGHQNVLL